MSAVRPTVDLVSRGAIVAVVVRIGTEARDVGSFADVTAAGSVALWMLNALHESYNAGLSVGFDSAQRALAKVGGQQ